MYSWRIPLSVLLSLSLSLPLCLAYNCQNAFVIGATAAALGIPIPNRFNSVLNFERLHFRAAHVQVFLFKKRFSFYQQTGFAQLTLFFLSFLFNAPHKSCWLEAISQTDWNRVCLSLFVVNFELPIMHSCSLPLCLQPLKLSLSRHNDDKFGRVGGIATRRLRYVSSTLNEQARSAASSLLSARLSLSHIFCTLLERSPVVVE